MHKVKVKMKLRERIKSYKFWVALSASLIILLQTLGKAFGFEIDAEIINAITMAFCSVLMVFGIVEKPKTNINSQENKNADSEYKNPRTENKENSNKFEKQFKENEILKQETLKVENNLETLKVEIEKECLKETENIEKSINEAEIIKENKIDKNKSTKKKQSSKSNEK